MATSNPDLFKVNLLVHKEDQLKIEFKLVKWLLSSGKFIVIFVEIIVVGAFIARYKMDADLAAIKAKIAEQVPYIQSLKEDEILIKQTQFQLNTIKQIRQESPAYTSIMQKISQETPQDIILSNVALDRTRTYPTTSITITGTTPNTISLAAFLRALQKDSSFTDVTLTNLSLEEKSDFTITANLNGKGGS
ncbi:MAG: PilN domain-containing protein [Patescibacteria group bacterium]|nr:PilN domain-containing protein [Patescibacteria group bacterium]